MHRECQPHQHHHAHARGARRRVSWPALAICLAAAYAATGFYSVQPGEKAIVRRCGRALPESRDPGLHFGLPYPLDRVDRVRMIESKQVAVRTTLTEQTLGRRGQPSEAECLSGDRNLILVSAIVQYHVRLDAPGEYLFNTADVATLVHNTAAAALTSAVASRPVDKVLTVDRLLIQNEVRDATQAALDDYGAGVRVTAVALRDVGPPPPVEEAFRDVNSAREDRQRMQNVALKYAAEREAQTRSEENGIALAAEAEAYEIRRTADGEAARFLKQREALATGRQIAALRLILETAEEVLPRVKKIVVNGETGRAVDLGIIEAGP